MKINELLKLKEMIGEKISVLKASDLVPSCYYGTLIGFKIDKWAQYENCLYIYIKLFRKRSINRIIITPNEDSFIFKYDYTDKEILEALEIVNLTSEKDKKYSKYSLGMKQKLGIAQAIMEKTKFIVLDEPFNGIERETVTRIKDYLKSLKDKGVTIIISSHIKEDLNELVDEMIYFEDGEILSEAN